MNAERIRKIVFAAILLASLVARADQVNESWTIEGKSYTTKAAAVRAVIAAGHPVTVKHERMEIMTNKLSFKALPKTPKTKEKAFENEQFESIHATK